MSRRKLIIGAALIFIFTAGAAVLFLLRQPVRDEVTIEDLKREEIGRIKGEQELQRLEEANPLVQYLPYRTQNFEVHYKVSGPTGMEAIYKVILHPRTKPSDAGYKEEISQLTVIVRDWIKSKGIDPDSILIEWTTATP